MAFSWNGEQQDNFDIYAKVVDRDDLVRLTRDPAHDGSPAWSPDGRRIAFVRDGTVFVISPLGGAETKVADLQAGHIEWTHDGRSLVVSAGQIGECRLLLLSVETRETKELTSPSRKGFVFGDRTFAISPDGLRLAFARFRSISAADLYLLPLAGGEPRRLTQNEGDIQGVTWTSDGRELVYASDRVTSLQTLWRRSVDAPVDAPSKRIESAGPGARPAGYSKDVRITGPPGVRRPHFGYKHLAERYGGITPACPQSDRFNPGRDVTRNSRPTADGSLLPPIVPASRRSTLRTGTAQTCCR